MIKVDFKHPIYGMSTVICDSISSEDSGMKPMFELRFSNESSMYVFITSVKHISISKS